MITIRRGNSLSFNQVVIMRYVMTFTFTKHGTIPIAFLLDHSAPVKLNMLKEKTSHLSKGHFLSNMNDFWPDDCCSHNSCRIRQFICPATVKFVKLVHHNLTFLCYSYHPSSFTFLLVRDIPVVQEVDRVLFEVSALVIVLDDHSDVFVSGHALHLAVGEAQA